MKAIKDYLETCVAGGAFPGAAWAIGGKETLETGAVGLLGAGLEAAAEDSLYDLASLTKLFTTLALMKQLEDGLIRLEDRVDYFLPAFRDSPLGGTTLFRLLTHTAPLPGGTMLYRYAHTREDLLEAIRSTGIRRDEGALYTCEAFILLGEIASAVDSAGLDELIRVRVTAPLGMAETGYNPPDEKITRIAPTEVCPRQGVALRGQVHDENAAILGGVSGNAGIFSTVRDMARLAAAVLDSLEGRGDFLHRPTASLMTSNLTQGRGENRGLGWMLKGPGSAAGDLMPEESFGHTGFTGTSLWIDPSRRLYAILLSNRIHPRRDNAGIFRVRHIFHNLAILRCGGGTQGA
ncbi:MAG: beta-lactamase family protein [Treponema sp.]|jgi:CubicO group peptidase (beta-lactamase class C family)|nr:beta-lactamase family protein [Treponema sp.]